MSMSTPQGGGGNDRSSRTVRVSGKTDSVNSTKTPDTRRSSASANRSRPPAPQMRVAKQRDWSWIAIIAVAAVLAGGIVGYAIYNNYSSGRSWQSKADSISGILDYRKSDPKLVATRDHQWGPITYTVTPPVAGNHNYNWQRCAGDVYPAQIANEHAVHSMEHGAVWVTYNPATLSADQVAKLSTKVKSVGDYILMSPYPGLKTPISLQAWGFQLPLQSADDKRIDQFIHDLRINASMEPGVDCSSGSYITATGTTPHDLGKGATDSGTTAPDSQPGATPAPSQS